VTKWEDQKKLIEINQRLSFLQQEVGQWLKLIKEVKDLEELTNLATQDPKLQAEVQKAGLKIWKKLEDKEIQAFLSGEFDKNNAVLTVNSGAGGRDAQDWAAILLRMYQRFCERKNFKTKILSQSFGEPGPEGRIGIKEAVLEIKGKLAYGLLKGESGVHRLVRISPFSAKNLRHTSFALVEVMPQLPEVDIKDVEIKEEDLRIDTYRASGPGGQYVNKRESAVRITHIPTKISVSCQAERTQGLNRKKATEMLKSKLLQRRKSQEKAEAEKIKGKTASPEWGNQIRSYIFYPYKMVKDHRTGVETSQLEDVLDGNIDDFIKAEIQL